MKIILDQSEVFQIEILRVPSKLPHSSTAKLSELAHKTDRQLQVILNINIPLFVIYKLFSLYCSITFQDFTKVL